MATPSGQITQENFAFSSSIADDVWHSKTSSKAFEWWYFDALSEDGRDAVVIIFLDNFIFSPDEKKLSIAANVIRRSLLHITATESQNIAPLTNLRPKNFLPVRKRRLASSATIISGSNPRLTAPVI
jgi:hypothetical protein